MIIATVIIPWSLKPIFGFIMDSFPIFGKKRKYYIVLTATVAALASFFFGMADMDATDLENLMLTQSICSAFGDVATDALISQRSIGKPVTVASKLQTLIWSSLYSMNLIMSFGWVSLVDGFGGWRALFRWFAAPIYLIVAFLALTIKEPDSHAISMRASWIILQDTLLTIFEKDVFAMVSFGFLYRSTPSIDLTLYYRYEHGFTDTFISHLKGYATLAAIAAAFASQFYIDKTNRIPYRALIFGSTVVEVCIGCMPLLITTGYYEKFGMQPDMLTLGGGLFCEVVEGFQVMIFFTVLSRKCVSDSAGTTFAVMMAMLNAGSKLKKHNDVVLMNRFDITCEYESGEPVCNWDGLTISIIICQITSFVLLPLVMTLPKAIVNEQEEEDSVDDDHISNDVAAPGAAAASKESSACDVIAVSSNNDERGAQDKDKGKDQDKGKGKGRTDTDGEALELENLRGVKSHKVLQYIERLSYSEPEPESESDLEQNARQGRGQQRANQSDDTTDNDDNDASDGDADVVDGGAVNMALKGENSGDRKTRSSSESSNSVRISVLQDEPLDPQSTVIRSSFYKKICNHDDAYCFSWIVNILQRRNLYFVVDQDNNEAQAPDHDDGDDDDCADADQCAARE